MSATTYHITGAQFLEQIEQQGPKAFDQLFDTLYPALCVFADRYVNDTEAARDIISELFVSLWKDQQKLTTVSSVAGFLYTAAKYRCYNHVRNEQNARKQEALLHNSFPTREEASIEQQIFESQYSRILYEAVEQLPGECKRVIQLGLKGLSTAEIAKELEITPSAVSNQKARAIRLLKVKIPLPVWWILWVILFGDKS